jgi:hypothetical protein
MRLSVANPSASATSSLNLGFIDFTSADDRNLPEAQAWRPHPARGIVIPTARQNGPIDWGDGEGAFYPTVAISPASSGRGYDMLNGSFGVGQLDINTGRAGTHASSPEANFSFSVAWFPYDAGWIGGNMGNPDATTGAPKWEGAGQHSAGLVPRLMTWSEFPAGSGAYGGLGLLRLPGVNALTNGMLFTTSSHGNSDVNLVGVAPVEEANGSSGWIVTVREDAALTGEEVATAGQYQFQFVYIPYNANNLIGGYVNGTTGDAIHSAGAFTLTHSELGTYELSIPGKTGDMGTLLLQVADVEEGTSVPMASRAFFSYQYNTATRTFVIQSRKALTETISELNDASFYFTWVDFAQPLSAPDGPRLRQQDAVTVADLTTINAKEGNLAVNTDEPELLITTVDQQNTGGLIDPITGAPALQVLLGYFYDPLTLTLKRGPFLIMGNSQGNGQITRHDVKYNPFTHEYNVVGCARLYDGVADLLMIARVSPDSSAGASDPLLQVQVYDGLTNTLSYDDVSLAVSERNGNFIVVAEHKVAGEGEGTYGALFGPDGAVLTPMPGRLDLLQGAGDEDDPDVIYLPSKDAFLYLSNTDFGGGLVNRLVGSVIQTTPDATGHLRVSGPEQSIASDTGPAQGHAASIENPFNGELITAFDTGGNDVSTGELSYYTIGSGPAYAFAEARPQVPYLAGAAAGDPFRHQHPQIAVDPNTGTFVVGYQARGSVVGYPNAYVFNVLDANGAPMPSPLGAAPYFLIDTLAGAIDTGANFHNIKYDPFSGSFVAVATAGDNGSRAIYLASVSITSSHLVKAKLSIEITSAGAVIRWPASATGYVLKSAPEFNSATWQTVAEPPVSEGASLRVTTPVSGNNRYFRLEK